MLRRNPPPDVVRGQRQRNRAELSREHASHACHGRDPNRRRCRRRGRLPSSSSPSSSPSSSSLIVVLVVVTAVPSHACGPRRASRLSPTSGAWPSSACSPCGVAPRATSPPAGQAGSCARRASWTAWSGSGPDEPCSPLLLDGRSARTPGERPCVAALAPSSERQPERPGRSSWTERLEQRGAESELPPGTPRFRAARGRRRTQSPGPHPV